MCKRFANLFVTSKSKAVEKEAPPPQHTPKSQVFICAGVNGPRYIYLGHRARAMVIVHVLWSQYIYYGQST